MVARMLLGRLIGKIQAPKRIQMNTIFISQDLWEFVEEGYQVDVVKGSKENKRMMQKLCNLSIKGIAGSRSSKEDQDKNGSLQSRGLFGKWQRNQSSFQHRGKDQWRTRHSTQKSFNGAVFIVCLLITCSLWSSIIILLVLAMVVVDLMGVMAILNIQLNAISVVNLVMSIGIAVEFCVHITHAFSVSNGNRDQRAREALSTIGASVLSGITLTKLVGVIVLRFARSEVFVIYYFQMYLALVLIGFLHGLVFLPVVLSICGPPSRCILIEERREERISASSVQLT